MTRDWDIIRAILLALEKAPTPTAGVNAKDLPEFDEQAVGYNMLLLREAGYIEASILKLAVGGEGRIADASSQRMTFAGHELLDTIRSPSVWDKIKRRLKDKGLDMTFDLVIAAGKSIASEILKGATGAIAAGVNDGRLSI